MAAHGEDLLLGDLAGLDLVHDVSSALEVALEIHDEPSFHGHRAFDLAPVARDLVGLVRRRLSQHLPDPLEGHVELTQEADQSSPSELLLCVAPVAGCLVDRRWRKESQLVVEPERLQAQPRSLRERPDRHQLVGRHGIAHRLKPGACPLGRVKRRF